MFFKKKLITDVSAEQIRYVTDILKENNINYDIKTITNYKYGSRELDAQLGKQYLQGPGGVNYIYIVFVNPKDYNRATNLIS